jgi:hypothetical protein
MKKKNKNTTVNIILFIVFICLVIGFILFVLDDIGKAKLYGTVHFFTYTMAFKIIAFVVAMFFMGWGTQYFNGENN